MSKDKKPKFDVKEMEKKWLAYWEKEKTYKFNPKSKKKIYAIDTPPPTVSGKMHIGHAYSYSQSDFIARYKRMKGFEVFYPFGTDDNGLPTEKLIERTKNVRSKSMAREEFIKICNETLKEILPAFVQDWKNLGVSCDYDMYYSTIDKHSQKISQKSFIDLYKKDLIYEDAFPTLFCPECQTPIAQAELEDKNKASTFNTIIFKAPGQDLHIATTRPELIGACVAIFVNPKDKRYKNLIGKKATIPLYNHEVEILADDSADMEKGTGALMVCSYGDKYDVDAIQRYKLTPRVVFDTSGRLIDDRYTSQKIKEARKNILKDLEEASLLIEKKEIEHIANVHDKCGTEIEFLPVKQWFVKILDKKKELIAQGKKVSWRPEFMFKRYENWINGLEWDWSISRERHFGIPVPVWKCEKCNETILAEEKELPIDPQAHTKNCPKCKAKATPETKVLDTWATSSLTPQIAGALTQNIKIPYSLRTQAHDIIRTWAFYTITKSLLHENKIPWENISVSGFVKLGGEKMSKSKGNVLSPQEKMEEYGSDALRYGAASQNLGTDMDFKDQDLVAGKKFITKILNATKFVFMNLEYNKDAKLLETDRLFLTQLNNLIENATKNFEEYAYTKAKTETDNFFWKTFSDNYVEIVKGRMYNGTKEEKESASFALYNGLLTILKLMAPITPFVTEELYQEYFKKTEKDSSIHLTNWPEKIKIKEHKEDQKIWDAFLETIGNVRTAKSENKKSMNAPIKLTLPADQQKTLGDVLEDLKSVTAAQEISEGDFGVEFID